MVKINNNYHQTKGGLIKRNPKKFWKEAKCEKCQKQEI